MKKVTLFIIIACVASGSLFCKKIQTDSELMGLIESAAQNCKVDTRYAFVTECKNDEVAKIEKIIAEKKVVPLLGTFTVALQNKDDKIKAVACKFLYRHYRDNIGELDKNRDKIDTAVVEALIKAVGETKEYVSFYAAEVVTHLAMMKGLETSLYAMLKSHPQEYTRLEGYRQLMRFGRAKAFDRVKELAGNSDGKIVLAALEAPNNMYEMTEQEKNLICPWAQGFLSHADDNAALTAARIMNQCRGKFIDAMLDEAAKRAKEGRLKPPFSRALTQFMFSCESIFGSPPTGTPEQCARREELKKKIVE